MMIINGIQFDPHQLMTKDALLRFLADNGGDDHALEIIRERNMEAFGNSLVWQYPISDGKHTGAFIVVAKDGFISLPYNEIDRHGNEKLELEDASEFDKDSMEIFIDDWDSFSSDLTGAMGNMLAILRDE